MTKSFLSSSSCLNGPYYIFLIDDVLFLQTNCSALSLAHLTDYGNWCGLGNNGLDPVDGIDACCQTHDFCYSNIMQVRVTVALSNSEIENIELELGYDLVNATLLHLH